MSTIQVHVIFLTMELVHIKKGEIVEMSNSIQDVDLTTMRNTGLLNGDNNSSSFSSFSLNTISISILSDTIAPCLRSILIYPSVFNIWYALFTVIVLTPISCASCLTVGRLSPSFNSPRPIPITI